MKELCPKDFFFITAANEVNLHLPLQEDGFRWTDCLPGEITCFAAVIIAKQAKIGRRSTGNLPPAVAGGDSRWTDYLPGESTSFAAVMKKISLGYKLLHKS